MPNNRKAGEPVPAALRKRVVALLRKGQGVTYVQNETGLQWKTIDRIRREEGIPARKTGLNTQGVSAEVEARIEERLKESNRLSEDDIARAEGVSRSVVKRIRVRLGLPDIQSGARLDSSEETRERIARDDEIGRLRLELKTVLRRVTELENLRASILGLGEPKKPKLDLRPRSDASSERSAILHLSDVHYAEKVDLEEMDGVNSYDVAIADRRLAQTFDTVCRLLTDFWKGKRVERLHLCLGGDLVSGGIHPELTRTDEMMRLPSAKAVAARIADGVSQVRSRVGCPVDIYSVPGNHGRLTLKPETKNHVADSLDTLAAWFVESRLSGDSGVRVFAGNSIDCLFDVYGRPFLLTHGDRMGSRGGQGFLGPVATIIRGHLKLRADYATRGIILYKILSGHFHSTCELPTGYGNGSLGGWSNFARDLRAEKEPSRQNFLIVHSERGVIDFQKVEPGRREEGSIYQRG